ncbi:hypothetical protein R5R35_006064 [Gryllus longicercus]|uniref:Phosphoinositide phospholipase C n=1 Tax=Gryllus longicercus TaxID=2509291 RepID=A0AAN9W3J9_9ORTH
MAQVPKAPQEAIEPPVSALYPSLVESPEFKEVIDHRSKTVEQILEILKKGTQLWKVRSFTKWYRRTYYLDDKEGTVRYEPSHKAPCVHSPLRIVVDDIIDVRKGWKTDTFNKIEKKVERRRLKFPSQPSPVDERCCFSIIYSSNKQSLDLVAPEPKIADMWVRGLRHIVTVLKGLHQEERFERWLEQQFHEADVDHNNGLNFEESLKLLKQLNVKMPRNSVKKLFDEANTVKHTRNGEQVLDADEFVSFYMKLMTRNDIKDIYTRYTKNKEMTVADLLDFIHKEQKGHTTTKEECLTLIEAFEQSNLKMEGKLSLIGFTNMLMSEQFDAFKQHHKVVYQDMHQPLSHYYIATSHNTYLTGKQLHGESSVEGYIDALKQGCRCVEMDCWDGPDGEPIIYHGYTLTTKILFRDVLVDAIKPYSFHSSEYPVILSLENHLSPKQQEVLTKHLVEVLGDMLYTVPVNDAWEYLPSPEDLKRKIIIKAKKKAASRNGDDDDSSTEDEAEPPPGADNSSKDLKGKREVTHALSNLVNICEAVHFHSFEDTEANKKCYQMASFSEAKANKFIETKGPEFVKYNTKHLSRIYPAGTRTDSSNFKPIPYWNVGCQLVALNYQHAAKPTLYNDAKFDDNGGCGYVLKPEVLRKNSPYDPDSTENDKNQVTMKLTVISGQHIPKADNDAEGEIVDPYVKVKIAGHPKDNQKFKTEAVRNNGFNPRWDHDMIFTVKMPELAIIHFIVKDLSTTGKDVTLGTYAIPFNSLQEGYSHVYLKDYERNFVSPASIFIHAVII